MMFVRMMRMAAVPAKHVGHGLFDELLSRLTIWRQGLLTGKRRERLGSVDGELLLLLWRLLRGRR